MATVVIGSRRDLATARRLVVPVFATSVFVSAVLLFSIQPIVAKLLLPLLGGSPAVWNTCMLFFQTTLLAGYLYVFFVGRLNLRLQLIVQLLILSLALLSLPIRLTPSWANSVPATTNPSFWLLGCLIVLSGLPFFIISSNGPLLQKWFSQSRLASDVDPYVLYSVSNAGSLLALMLYPILLERYLSLQLQTQLWSAFYVVLVLLVGGCALLLWRARSVQPVEEVKPDEAGALEEKPGNKQRLQWVSLAFVPSTLMYGVTNYISTDIAAVPLLWVIPLAVYLLTLVIAFARRQPVSMRIARPILKLATIGLLSIYLAGLFWGAIFPVLIHLVYFAFVALVFHVELANRKPPPKYLASFYIWLCAGGALGGFFNCVVAPLLFRSIVEYPLAVALACLLLPDGPGEEKSRMGWFDFVLPACMLLLTLALGLSVHRILPWQVNGLFVALLIPFALSYFLQQRSFGFGLAVVGVLTGAAVLVTLNDRTTLASRNFFGVVRVVDQGNARTLMHGTTAHGRQFTGAGSRCEPLSYYHRQGPLGSVFSALEERTKETRVAMVGLGTGSAVAYARPNHRWTFYEINPTVVAVARDPRYFTYINECAQGPVDIVVGDARLRLRDAPDAHYDLIVLDAFSSDAIPVHLVTQQALDLYLAKLSPGGLISFHISNYYLDLGPVIANLAHLRGLRTLDLNDDKSDPLTGKDPSRWIVIGRDSAEFSSLEKLPGARFLESTTAGVWTDDFSNIVSAFKW